MEFENLDQIKKLFGSGEFTFPEEMLVSGIKYTSNRTTDYTVKNMLEKNYKAMWTYFTPYREQARQVDLDHAIIFLWGFAPGTLKMVPYDVRATTKPRLSGPILEKTDSGDSVNIPKERIVGDIVDVIIVSMPGAQVMKGKIDTGADISSLHADKWDIENGQVSFLSPELSENKITMPVIEKQAIKLSNGNIEYRPVIELNIKINDQLLNNCMFNLNDRGAMTYSMLIGQNVLEAGGFMIDPTIDASDVITNEEFEIACEELQEEFKDDIVIDSSSINKNKFMKEVIGFIKAGIKE